MSLLSPWGAARNLKQPTTTPSGCATSTFWGRSDRGRNLPTTTAMSHEQHHEKTEFLSVSMAMTAPFGKKPTACVPCHERKVRCDSTAVGFPCSRCITKDRTDLCIMLERGAKNSSKRRRTAPEADNLRSPRQREADIQQTPVRDFLISSRA